MGLTSAAVEKMAPWRHLANKEIEVWSSEETFPCSHTVGRQPSGTSDFQSRHVLLKPRLMASPHGVLGSG